MIIAFMVFGIIALVIVLASMGKQIHTLVKEHKYFTAVLLTVCFIGIVVVILQAIAIL